MPESETPLKIALLGTRGVPASYSGFETCVEQLGTRLAERGHAVTVYCRTHHVEDVGDTYRGMKLVKLPSVKSKHLDTISHSFLSTLHAIPQRFDAAYYFIAGNAPVTWMLRLFGTPTALNVDGLDWKRQKWGGLAKRYIQFSEWFAQFAPTLYFTDSPLVQQYYKDKTGKAPPYIVYGSEIEKIASAPGSTLDQLGLEARKYILFVGRLVPENNAHHLIEAFRGLDTDMKCVVVGDAPYAEDYKAHLRELAGDDPRILMPGYVFGKGYQELGSNAYAYVATTGVGGTHPALVEAMSMGNCCVVNDTPVNLQTIDGNGFSYEGSGGAEALRSVLQRLLDEPKTVEAMYQAAEAHAAEAYSWEKVTDEYEKLAYELAKKSVPERLIHTPSKLTPGS